MIKLPDGAPAWYRAAFAEIGVREVGNNSGPNVARYIKLSQCGALGEPWCAIFVNAMLESVSLRGSRSPSSQSFRFMSSLFRKLDTAALGAIAVFERGSPGSGIGHVGFYSCERDDRVWILGGNEGDMVQDESFAKNSAQPYFKLLGYYWPVNSPLPICRPIIADDSRPHSISSVPKVV